MQEVWINARFLTQQVSGVQKFAIELSQELKLINPSIRFVSPENIIHPEIAKKLGVITFGNRKGQLWEQLDLPKFLKNNNNPLLINFCNSAPVFYKNNIVTIHDLAFLENSKWFSFNFRVWYKYLIPRICKKAKYILTVSEFSKKELVKKLTIDSKNISVIYNGLPTDLINYKTTTKKLGQKKFILSVGSINPRKNIKNLIQAFNSLHLDDYELLIVGGNSSNFRKEKIKNVNERVKFLDYVEDKKLWELYKNAQLFVYPSLYEGFGIPVLEALYFDCPTIVAPLEVYKEVYDNFELNYSEGYKPKDYAKAIKKLIEENLKELKLPERILNKCSYQEGAIKINKLINN